MIHGDHWHSCTWNGVGGMESTCCCILLLGAGYIDPYKSNWCDAFTSDIPAKTLWCPMFAFKGIFKFCRFVDNLQVNLRPNHPISSTINGSGNFGDTAEVGVSQNSDHDFETMRTVCGGGLGDDGEDLRSISHKRIDAWKRGVLEVTSYKLVFWECNNKMENNSNYIYNYSCNSDELWRV